MEVDFDGSRGRGTKSHSGNKSWSASARAASFSTSTSAARRLYEPNSESDARFRKTMHEELRQRANSPSSIRKSMKFRLEIAGKDHLPILDEIVKRAKDPDRQKKYRSKLLDNDDDDTSTALQPVLNELKTKSRSRRKGISKSEHSYTSGGERRSRSPRKPRNGRLEHQSEHGSSATRGRELLEDFNIGRRSSGKQNGTTFSGVLVDEVDVVDEEDTYEESNIRQKSRLRSKRHPKSAEHSVQSSNSGSTQSGSDSSNTGTMHRYGDYSPRTIDKLSRRSSRTRRDRRLSGTRQLFEELKKKAERKSQRNLFEDIRDMQEDKSSLHSELKKKTKTRKEPERVKRNRGSSRTTLHDELKKRTKSRPDRSTISRNRTDSRNSLLAEIKVKSKKPKSRNSRPSDGVEKKSLHEELKKKTRISRAGHDDRRARRTSSVSSQTMTTRSTVTLQYTDLESYTGRDPESLSTMSSLHDEIRKKVRQSTLLETSPGVPQYLRSGESRSVNGTSERSGSRESVASSLSNSVWEDDYDKSDVVTGKDEKEKYRPTKEASSYFIPGITGKPRCLEPTKEASEETDESMESGKFLKDQGRQKAAFFIPGINGTARCLDSDRSVDTENESRQGRQRSTRSFRVASRSPVRSPTRRRDQRSPERNNTSPKRGSPQTFDSMRSASRQYDY